MAQAPARAGDDAKQVEKLASPLDSPTFIIVDDPKRIGDLFERLDSPDFRLVRPDRVQAEAVPGPNSGSFVKTVSIRGQMIGSIASLTIRLEIQQTRAGQIWTPIGLDGLVLRSARSNGQAVPTAVLRPGGPWRVRTDSAGTHAIEIELGTEIVSDRSTRRMTLSIPEAASTELNMEVPEQVLFATTNARDSLRTRYVAARNAYEISGLLTARNRVDLRWLGQSLIRNEDRVRLDCRGQVAIRMDLDAVSTRQLWQIRPLAGIPTVFEFEMPEDETLLDLFVDGQAVRPRFEKARAGAIVVSADNPASIKGPSADSISIEMVTKAAYAAIPANAEPSGRLFNWHPPRWKNGEIVSGIVSLELPEKWVYEADPKLDLDAVDPRDLPDRLRKSANQSAFRFTGADRSLKLKSRRRQPPLFTDVRTIGIVRRSQVEYVSDIVIQGEIDPQREYEIELDQAARPLFVGPRDVWERYEFTGESVAGERKLRRLRLTPNRSLSAETPTTLRIRYLRRSDSADAFQSCLPRFVDSTGETHRTWLLPEPSIAIEPAAAELGVRKRLPDPDSAVFANLLEQSVGDEDKWIDPRAAAELPGAFFRSTNAARREIVFRTIVRPPSLDCIQHLYVTPARDAIRLRHVFECVVQQGNFERVIVVPGRDNSIRNLRYTLTHEDETQSGNLIAEGGVFVIPLPEDIARQFELSLEAVRGWPDGHDGEGQDGPGPQVGHDFDAASFDFSVSDGVLLQRDLTLLDSIDAVSRLEDRADGWVEIASDPAAGPGRSRTWAAADARAAWPSIRTLPIASGMASAAVPIVREILAAYVHGRRPALAVAYRVAAGTGQLRLERREGWSVASADFEGEPIDVALAGDAWSVDLQRRPGPGLLRVRFRADRPVPRVEIPLPAGLKAPQPIPTALRVFPSGYEWLLPPWRSGWHAAAADGFDDFEAVTSSAFSDSDFDTFRTDDPSRPLPVRFVPLSVALSAAFLTAFSAAAVAIRRGFAGGVTAPTLAIAVVAAFVAAGQLGVEWAVAIGVGVLAAAAFVRGSSKPQVAAALPMVQAVREASNFPPAVPIGAAIMADEPSTVLKHAVTDPAAQQPEDQDDGTRDQAPDARAEEARWSIDLDVPSASAGAGSSLSGEAADQPS